MSPESSHQPKACVIGWPAGHSRSPIIHGYWLAQHGLAGSYERAAVAPEDFASFVHDFARNGFVGANVTLPHKQAAFELCDATTETAAKLQAVNTLWLEDGKLRGDNTDVEGFLAALDQEAPGWAAHAGKAVVLGAGGAARAIIQALLLCGVKKITLINRTKDRALELAGQAGAAVEAADWAEPGRALSDADLLVNTTSLGMKGQPPLEIDLGPLPAQAVVSDIVYVPLETELLRMAKARGLRGVSGLGMLLHQAAPGFSRWFGVRPIVTAELRALVEADILKSV